MQEERRIATDEEHLPCAEKEQPSVSSPKSKSKSKAKTKSKATKKKLTTNDEPLSSVLTSESNVKSTRTKTKSTKTKKMKRKKHSDGGESLGNSSTTHSTVTPTIAKSSSYLPRPQGTKKNNKNTTKKGGVSRTKSLEQSSTPKRDVERSKSLDLADKIDRSTLSIAHLSTNQNPGRGRGSRGRGSLSPVGGRGRGRVQQPSRRGPPRTSRSSERKPSSDRSRASRSRSGDSVSSMTSRESRGRRRPGETIYKAPSPLSQKTTSYRQGILRHSSHHSPHSPKSKYKRSVCINEHNLHSNFDSDIESDDDNDDDRSIYMEGEGEKSQKTVSRTLVRSLSNSMKKSIRNFMTMDMSGHSRGLGTGSSPQKSATLSRTPSSASIAMLQHPEFEGENRFIRALRYIHILAPHPNEHPIKKNIRIVTLLALFMDFLNALVAIITYGGKTTQCCGKSIMSAFFGGKIDWDKTILVITSVYMALIFMEVLPVMRDTFPFNLLNPFVGFLITFAVFFSDSIMEAIIMWIVEGFAVGCEVLSYRLRVKLYGERKAKLKQAKKDIQEFRKIKRKVKNQYENGKSSKSISRPGSDDALSIGPESDSMIGDDSVFDEAEMQQSSTIASRSSHEQTTMSDIGDLRETRLLRERRELITSQSEDERDLHIHLIGVSINVSLVILSLLMIVIIGKNGGMCIRGMKFGNIFKNDQLDKCYTYKACVDPAECEEYCPTDEDGELTEESQCYYPYGVGK